MVQYFIPKLEQALEVKKFRFLNLSMVMMQKILSSMAKNEDKRITKIGKIIRAIRFDELPQLLSVLEGSMSLIGPRPERPEIEKEFLRNSLLQFSNYLETGN